MTINENVKPKKNLIVFFLPTSIDARGHIVSQLKNEIKCFIIGKVPYLIICSLDTYLCLLDEFENDLDLQSLINSSRIIPEVLNLKYNKTSNNELNKLISVFSSEVTNILQTKIQIYLPWWGSVSEDYLIELDVFLNKMKIEMVINGQISDVIRRNGNSLDTLNGKKLVLCLAQHSVRKILYFDAIDQSDYLVRFLNYKKLQFLPVYHEVQIKNYNLPLNTQNTFGFFGQMSAYRGLFLFTWLSLLNSKVIFIASGWGNPEGTYFTNIKRIPFVGIIIQRLIVRMIKIYQQLKKNFYIHDNVLKNTFEWNKQINSVDAVYSSGNKSFLASGLSLHALGNSVPVIFKAGNSANSDILKLYYPIGKLNITDILILNKIDNKITKLKSDMQSIVVNQFSEFSAIFLAAFDL